MVLGAGIALVFHPTGPQYPQQPQAYFGQPTGQPIGQPMTQSQVAYSQQPMQMKPLYPEISGAYTNPTVYSGSHLGYK